MTQNDKKFFEICKENKEVILALIINNRYNENLLKTTIGNYLKLNFDTNGKIRGVKRGETELWNDKMK